MANNLKEKVELLDAISSRALALKRSWVALINQENGLADDIDRLREIYSADFEFRDEIRAKEAEADQKKKEKLAEADQKKNEKLAEALRKSSASSPAAKRAKGSAPDKKDKPSS